MKKYENKMEYLLSLSLFAIVILTPTPSISAQRSPQLAPIAEEESPSATKLNTERQHTTSSSDSHASDTQSDTSRSNTPSPTLSPQSNKPAAQEAGVYSDTPTDYPLPLNIVHERAVEEIFKQYFKLINSNPDLAHRKKMIEMFFNVTVPHLYHQYIAQHFNHISKKSKSENIDAYKLAMNVQKSFQQRYGFKVFRKVDEKFRKEYGVKPVTDYEAHFNNLNK